MPIELRLAEAISHAVSAINIQVPASEIKFNQTRKEFRGSITFTCFQLAKQAQQSPEQLGAYLGAYLTEHVSEVTHYNVVKGFLNLELSDTYLVQQLGVLASNQHYGQAVSKNQKVMVEYASPNTNKPLHLGHLRNIFLGNALARILASAGYNVVKTNLVNDRGIHICKSMLAYMLKGNNETPESAGIKGDHLVGKYYVIFDQMLRAEADIMRSKGATEVEIERNNPLLLQAQDLLRKWEEGHNETVALWKKMNTWVYAGFDDTFQKIGVDFDHTYYESNTYVLGKNIVEEGLQKGVFFKKPDGSVWIDLSGDGLDEKLVQRADGTSVYITQDMGTADLKYTDFGCEKSVYVVGNEQDYHFKVLFLILKKLGRPYADGLVHLSYGMVDLPSGKMKSREGTVVDADDLYAEMLHEAEQQTTALGKTEGFDQEQLQILHRTIGLGALKYFLLKVDPKKRMLFNPAESIDFHGNTGPFIQYTYARIQSILRKASYTNGATSLQLPASYILHETERNTLTHLFEYERVISESAQTFAPSLLANYVYDLSKLFNAFYAECSIVQESDEQIRQFRLVFAQTISKTISHAMALLGIDVPEKM